MSLSQLNSSGSPLNELQLTRLQQAMQDMNPTQIAWVGGYLAGMSAQAASPVAVAKQTQRLTILYGSQTGNAQGVAEKLADGALAQGLEVEIVSTADFRARDLAKRRLLLLVVSTQGEGEPPESAYSLHQFIHSKRAPRLDELRYAVLGLGDSSYEHFNQAAQDFDERLTELGAKRLFDRVDADVDYAAVAQSWGSQVLDRAAAILPERNAQIVPLPGVALNTHQRPTKDRPHAARLLEQRRITTPQATIDVRHLVLAVDPDEIRYTPGDSLGVWFHNDPALVETVLATFGLDGSSTVDHDENGASLSQLLTERLELTQLHPGVVKAWAKLSDNADLHALVADKGTLREFINEHQFVDLALRYPARPTATQLSTLLNPLQPRLYSIASSQDDITHEVHLSVAVSHKGGRLGGASGYLAERLLEDDPLDVYVVENPGFRLPENGGTPIILIGAGTGIAPYRAFLQHRAIHGQQGANWLVFGNRQFHHDFLYQTDWKDFRTRGLLTRTSLAFSRDQSHKVYVQNRLKEDGAELYRWLADGAHLYLCGGADMARSVHKVLLDIVGREAQLSEDEAMEYLDELRQEGRYQRDVY